MLDEEKKALEILNNTEWDGFMITIKNLIEKQQKEIEELKEKNEYLPNWVNRKYISKDEIKARIKELEEYLYKGNIKDDFFMIRIKAKIQELQSLLEKE